MKENKINRKLVFRSFGLLSVLFLIFLLIGLVHGLKNPSRVYCEQMDYIFTTQEISGQEYGICKFDDVDSCKAWEFLKGECGVEFSYCSKNGLDIKTITNWDVCGSISLETCSVCVLDNGTEIEVTKLMNLSFVEGSCGNGVCAIGENYGNCPQDCPSGSLDVYCDGIEDGICDPDCNETTDVDCKPECGDEVCEKGENYGNCPTDCSSGINDSYCDEVEDGVCDPDCLKKEDKDCQIIERCGNNVCDPGENYMNCEKDCGVGAKDGYCTGFEDGVCDPDCTSEEDKDCEFDLGSNLWIYVSAGIFVLIILFIIFMSVKIKKE